MLGLRQLVAPAHWRTLDFISDLHLEPQSADTHATWVEFMDSTPADAVFILGDLFEVWVGDDQLQQGGFVAQCVQTLARAGQRLSLFFMHGNRDFLIGSDFLRQCKATLLADPCTLITAAQTWQLAHGDALCLDDTAYLQFREQVRSSSWQAQFLALPLVQRQALARQMRQHSQEQQAQKAARGQGYAEVDARAAERSLEQAGARTLIHGHTHRPARHELGAGRDREVLSDWDAQAHPPRAQVLRMTVDESKSSRLQRIDLL